MYSQSFWTPSIRPSSKHESTQKHSKNSLEDGSNVRIVVVGNNILQFKFSSMYQLNWMERNSPWNFDNNLLLLTRWRQGLSSTNTNFTHSPFWVQVWGLPFEYMNVEVGKELGRKLGNVIEVDKRSMQDDQVKFLRIKVDLPIDKPLRRGGYIFAYKGEQNWVSFRCERLPTFFFLCGKLGHNENHCESNQAEKAGDRQYGEWMRARGLAKTGGEKVDFSDNKKLKSKGNDCMNFNPQLAVENLEISSQIEGEKRDG